MTNPPSGLGEQPDGARRETLRVDVMPPQLIGSRPMGMIFAAAATRELVGVEELPEDMDPNGFLFPIEQAPSDPRDDTSVTAAELTGQAVRKPEAPEA